MGCAVSARGKALKISLAVYRLRQRMLSFGEAFGCASLHVFDRGGVMPHSDDGDGVEGAVGGSVSAPAEAVTVAGASAAGWLGSNTAEFGEGG